MRTRPAAAPPCPGAPVLPLAACALLLALAAFPAAAEATWPGKPGKIAYQRVDLPIFSIRPDGSHNRRLVRQATGDPAWSPRGRSIAYPLTTELWRVRADGSRRRRIARVDEAILDPAWGPRGRLVFTSGITRQSDSTSINYLWTVRWNGKGLRRLSKGHDATWSSDGTIAFATNSGAVATMRPDGSGRRVWIPGKRDFDITNIDFSPNGRRIVYQRFGLDGGRSTINTFNFHTGRRTRFANLTKRVFADDVAWRPGGRRLAYSHRSEYPPGPPAEIRTIRPSGKRRKTLIRFRTARLVPGVAWQTRR